MTNRIVCLFLAAFAVTSLSGGPRLNNAFKRWVGKMFGINTSEEYTGQKFNPTLSNLNAVILRPSTQDEISEESRLSVSELAHMVDQKCLPDDAYLALPRKSDQKEMLWQVHTGLDTVTADETVIVYSRGFAGSDKPISTTNNTGRRGMWDIPKQGGGIVVGAQWLKNSVVNAPCLIFDYPDTRNTFDLGLAHDQECLKTIHTSLLEKTENIVFFGNCRGSKALINYLCKEQPQAVKAVVLEAPFLDLEHMAQEIEKNYGKHIPFTKNIARHIITKWFPCYDAKQDLTLEDLKHIPKHIPLFLAHLQGDTLIGDNLIKDMVKTLRDSGHTVYLLVIADKTKAHSTMYQTASFTKAVNAFLKRYDLPHDPQLAAEGRRLLGRAKANARDIDKWPRGFIYVCKEA